MNKDCQSCDHFYPTVDDVGQCRRRAPRLALTQIPGSYGFGDPIWPAVSCGDWCGEWKAK